MTTLSELINQIEHLSADSQAKVADYISFLQWQEAQQPAEPATEGWQFSFIEAFKEASISTTQEAAGLDVKMGPATVGGERQPALWAHPPVTGQAVIEYYVPIPQQVTEVRLKLAIGIRDGAQIDENNLVAFGVKLNGVRTWSQQTNESVWQRVDIPLNLLSGDMAHLAFTTEALGSHEWNWAVWGNPKLVGKIKS